jgi:alkanesulfonate monooxygenase SsuD/methylene tetrahydromethanopterin reductase-like flavin-dependent oxidoreductase (luciferase family)
LVRVKFGLRIPGFPIDDSSCTDFVNQTLMFVGKLEPLFDSAWVCDHVVPWARFAPKIAPTLEGFTAISYLSGVFQNLTFGNIVLCNSFRNPAFLAKMGATLQSLSRGRFVLGIGAGWKEDEYIAYGYEFPVAKLRIQQLQEGVQIIKKMWTEDSATFKGRYYEIKEAVCHPKPEPVPPIMIGGGGEKLTLRVVACQADWWNLPNVSPKTFQHKLRVLGDHCAKVGRDPDEIVKTLANNIAIARTEEEAWSLASNNPFIPKGIEENYIVGNPDSVIEKLSEYSELGVEHLILRFVDFPKTDGATLFAEKVIPAFTSRS